MAYAKITVRHRIDFLNVRNAKNVVAVYTVQQFFHVLDKLNSDTCRNLLNLTKCELDGFDFCLRIRMPRLSGGLILHVRQHEIVWKYII